MKTITKDKIFKGVCKSSRYAKKPYRAYIVKNNKQYHLGTYDTEIEAAFAYDKKARELFGEFARTNFPDVSEGIEKAVVLTYKKYKNSKRRNGRNTFYSHLLPVAKLVYKKTNSTSAFCAAIMHDTIEDRKMTVKQLLALDIPKKSKELVLDMSKLKNEWYLLYILRIIRKRDPILMELKIADINSNDDEYARPVKKHFLYPFSRFLLEKMIDT